MNSESNLSAAGHITVSLVRELQTYKKILAWNMSFSDRLTCTQSAQDITCITELLQYNPADRLGVRGGTSATLHPWPLPGTCLSE